MRALTLALLLAACAPKAPPNQDAVVAVEFLPPPCADNPVELGASLTPDDRAQAMAILSSVVAGRLPGVRFLVIRGPVFFEGAPTESYRVWGRDAYAVLGWYPSVDAVPGVPAGGVALPGAEWEVSHLVAGTDDFGNPAR